MGLSSLLGERLNTDIQRVNLIYIIQGQVTNKSEIAGDMLKCRDQVNAKQSIFLHHLPCQQEYQYLLQKMSRGALSEDRVIVISNQDDFLRGITAIV